MSNILKAKPDAQRIKNTIEKMKNREKIREGVIKKNFNLIFQIHSSEII